MIKAGSLFFVIVISTVIGILSTALVLIALFNSEIALDYTHSEKVRLNALSGTNLILGWQDHSTSALDTILDLFGNKTDSVHLQIKRWGVFSVGSVKAFDKRWSNSQLFLFGAYPTGESKAALYLTDLKRPLTVVGSTDIVGNVYLPQAGIHSGYVDGKNFTKSYLFSGKSFQSQTTLPQLDGSFLEPCITLLIRKDTAFIKKHSQPVLPKSDSVFQSFKDSTLWEISKSALNLSNVKLAGNIIVCSAKSILVDSTVSLDGVILIAPTIKIKGHSSGSLQAFATDSLITGANCAFNYPSALILVKDKANKSQPLIELGTSSLFSGVLISTCTEQDVNLSAVYLKKGTSFRGIAYVNGYLELKGSVEGTVMTDHFLYKSPSTIYENNLIDVSINRTKLSQKFLGSATIASDTLKQGLIKWLN